MKINEDEERDADAPLARHHQQRQILQHGDPHGEHERAGDAANAAGDHRDRRGEQRSDAVIWLQAEVHRHQDAGQAHQRRSNGDDIDIHGLGLQTRDVCQHRIRCDRSDPLAQDGVVREPHRAGISRQADNDRQQLHIRQPHRTERQYLTAPRQRKLQDVRRIDAGDDVLDHRKRPERGDQHHQMSRPPPFQARVKLTLDQRTQHGATGDRDHGRDDQRYVVHHQRPRQISGQRVDTSVRDMEDLRGRIDQREADRDHAKRAAGHQAGGQQLQCEHGARAIESASASRPCRRASR